MSQLAKVFTRASTGLDAPVVTIEVHISGPTYWMYEGETLNERRSRMEQE